MKLFLLLCSTIFLQFSCSKKSDQLMFSNTAINAIDSIYYLALGDSYTIGTSIDPSDNYPNQTFQNLTGAGFKMAVPQIIAKNGWTSLDLINALKTTEKRNTYQVVSLLIGVNNQYQGRSMVEFESNFQSLLASAIVLTGNVPKKVFVFSLPDWGITPFAAGLDKQEIATEIDAYNTICAKYAKLYGANFINITDDYRLQGFKTNYLAIDGLHPSKLIYAAWSKQLAQQIINGF
jgi:lysophospholipase L1-like esterase